MNSDGKVAEEQKINDVEEHINVCSQEVLDKVERDKEDVYSQRVTEIRKENLQEGESILHLIEEVVKVGQTMGYNMNGRIENMEAIMNIMSLNIQGLGHKAKRRSLWGNYAFDYAISPSLAICLDRHLSDHRPILLKEVHSDYGAIPFRMFNSWFQMDGFDKIVEQTWKSIDIVDPNGLIRLKKKLQGVLMDGDWVNEPVQVKHAFFFHFADRFNKKLERNVSDEEIKRVVWDCGASKSPGPDGYTFEFFRRYWNFIEQDILDGPFILNELISWCKSKKNKAIVFKADLEKAYDSIRWDYLNVILRSLIQMGLAFCISRFFFVVEVYSSYPRHPGALDRPIKISRHSPWLDIIKEVNVLRSKGIDLMGYCSRKSLTGSGEFSVKSVRNLLDDSLLSSNSLPTRWVKVIPIKINVFAWKVQKDRLPCRLNLSRLGIDIPSLSCPICDSGVECLAHLLFTCPLAQAVLRRLEDGGVFLLKSLIRMKIGLLGLLIFVYVERQRMCLKAHNLESALSLPELTLRRR
nr:RNA-directed DNA polymerase, eukaryota [Tanacetum cinerariifolium]